jgi:hypothetical protein
MIELHTIAPKLTAANLWKTAATTYDATHGFSDQYIVEIPALHKIAADAELYPNINFFRRCRNSPIATVSINLLKGIGLNDFVRNNYK